MSATIVFFRSLTAELFIGRIVVRCASDRKRTSEDHNVREMAMKHHLTVLGCFLLLATLGFALDVGVIAILLRI